MLVLRRGTNYRERPKRVLRGTHFRPMWQSVHHLGSSAMRDEFKPAIAALQGDLKEIERKAVETKRAINRLCELAGAPPMYVVSDDGGSKPGIATMRNDQFYGKVLTTATREYLEMRNAANLGPATPREIYEALVTGGFKFDTKIENNAIAGLRQVLRKNSSIFHRLPQGVYGLLAWYPNAKAAKSEDDDEDGAAPTRATKAKPAKQKPAKAKADRSANSEPTGLGPFIMDIMKDGGDWSVSTLKEKLDGKNLVEPEQLGRKIMGTLLSLASQKLVVNAGNKNWRSAGNKTAAIHEGATVSKTAH